MTASLGTLPQFRPDRGNFEVYLERFELFAAANNFSEEKIKQQIFLTGLDDDAYLTLRRILFPKSPTEASLEEACRVLKNYYCPRLPLVAERYRFNSRKQEPHESVSDYILEIKRMAANCEFGVFVPELLRDRLIAGLQDDAIRRHLLTMPEVTFDRACAVAKAMETRVENGTSTPLVERMLGQRFPQDSADDFAVQCELDGVEGEGYCQTRHVRRFVECYTSVIYEIPLTCERVYVGQTGRCINDRLREHAASLSSTSLRLPTHCEQCGCEPVFEGTRILDHCSSQSSRVMLEASYIHSYGPDRCISEPSVKLQGDVLFLSEV